MELEYRTCTEEDGDLVHTFLMDHFRVTEPITTSLNASKEDVTDFFADLRDVISKDRYSTMVMMDGEVVGVCLNCVKMTSSETTDSLRMLDPYRDYSKDISAGPYSSRNANRLVTFVATMEEDFPILLGMPEKVFKIDVLCVRKDQHGRGIASSLVARSLEAAREAGCQWVVTAATAKASQLLFAKLGFRTIRELPFSCFREDGCPVYSNLPDGGRCGKLMTYHIEEEEEDDLK